MGVRCIYSDSSYTYLWTRWINGSTVSVYPANTLLTVFIMLIIIHSRIVKGEKNRNDDSKNEIVIYKYAWTCMNGILYCINGT